MSNDGLRAYNVYVKEVDGMFHATVEELPGIVGVSTTKEGAAEELRLKAAKAFEDMDALGIPKPEGSKVPRTSPDVLDAIFGAEFSERASKDLFEKIMGSLGYPDEAWDDEASNVMNNVGQIVEHYRVHIDAMLAAARQGDIEEFLAHAETLEDHATSLISQIKAHIEAEGTETAGQMLIREMLDWDSRDRG